MREIGLAVMIAVLGAMGAARADAPPPPPNDCPPGTTGESGGSGAWYVPAGCDDDRLR